MSFDSIFTSLSIDMLALESAVQLYQAENNIDDDYLLSNVSYDTPVTDESATENASDQLASDFAFGADLFEESIAMESEGTENTKDDNKESGEKVKFGDKLKNGIKSILAAIGKAFKTLGQKISELANKIKEKMHKLSVDGAAKKVTKLRDAVMKEAGTVRKAFQSAVNVLNQSIQTDAVEINKICVKINAAITAAKAEGQSASTENLDTVGNKYDGDADKDLSDITKRLENCKKAESLLTAQISNVRKAYEQLSSKLTKLKIADDKTTSHSYSEEVDIVEGGDKAVKAVKAASERYGAIAKDNKAAGKAFGKEHEKSEFADKNTQASSTMYLTKDMIKTILIKEEYTQKTSINELQKACKAVTETCSKNADFCNSASKIAEADLKDGSPAKKAFYLCKKYMEASSLFTRISHHITTLSTGNVFGSGASDDGVSGARSFKDED